MQSSIQDLPLSSYNPAPYKNNLSFQIRRTMEPYFSSKCLPSTGLIISTRQDYLSQLKTGLSQDDSQKNLQQNLIYRLANSSIQDTLALYSELKGLIEKTGIDLTKFQLERQKIDQILKIYEIFVTCENGVDPYYSFTSRMIKEFREVQSELKLTQLFQKLEIIESMKSKIMKQPFTINKTVIYEYGLQIYFQSEAEKRDHEVLSDQDSEENASKLEKVSIPKKKKQKEIRHKVQDVQDYVNYIQEFFQKFKKDITEGREFWTLNFFEILKELNSDKKDYELGLHLISLINNEDAVNYLLQHKNQICDFLDAIRFFEEETVHQKQKLSYNEKHKATNFGVNIKGSQTQQQKQQPNNYDNPLEQKIIKLLNLSGKEQKKKKESLTTHQPIQYRADVFYLKQLANVDYSQMDDRQLQIIYPTIDRIENQDFTYFCLKPIPRIKKENEQLVAISQLPEWSQKAFEGTNSLNTIQSHVFPCAFQSDENLMMCAPTGAGKTNVALLTILREISKRIDPIQQKLKPDLFDFKCIYICPMKALAAEIVEKFTSKLRYLGIICRELTGDMQLSKQEIQETQILVSTPEKWDVVTRKNDDGIGNSLKLLIIDEIHLLNDERGPVLECLVARTLKSIERLQSTVRLVGLSATLPNYQDVAQFMGVYQEHIYFFDASYRPVPLQQEFYGVKDAKGGRGRKTKQDMYMDIVYNITRRELVKGKQVMVFVHSRKDTLETAKKLVEMSKLKGEEHFFKSENAAYKFIEQLKHQPLKEICLKSVGIHNAGLLRKDRSSIEAMFLDGHLRVLVTTATLAWGVNLPAYCVIIKGTDIYEPNKGQSNLSILDVQQIFGRAGRPQFDTQGSAVLITDHSKVSQYLGQLNSAANIESQLFTFLKEALNAEISLGNISSQFEALEWLNHTFLAIRMRKSPLNYGLRLESGMGVELQVEMFIQEKLDKILDQLNEWRLIRYDKKNLFLSPTDLGRICSHYYIKCETMYIFCREIGIIYDNDAQQIKAYQDCRTDLQLLMIIAKSKEFDNIRVREDEISELREIIKKYWVFEENIDKPKQRQANDKNIEAVNPIENYEKILALISGYLFKVQYVSFSLTIDTAYVIQNCIRIMRCVMDICMKKNMAQMTELTMKWCKFLENRINPFELPLRHFCIESQQGNFNTMRYKKNQKEGFLPAQLISKLEHPVNGQILQMSDLREMDTDELARIMHTRPAMGKLIQKYITFLPSIDVVCTIKPVAQTILKVSVQIKPCWIFNPRWHNHSESFYIIVDDEIEILHQEIIKIPKKAVMNSEEIECTFYVPFRDNKTKSYHLKVISDYWIDAEFHDIIDLSDIIVNNQGNGFTKLLDLQPLPVSVLNREDFQSLYKFPYWNPIQTQLFHVLYHTDKNVLVGAPTGSGKTNIAEIAILRIFNEYPDKKVIYVAPMKALAKERILDWKKRLSSIGKSVLELTGDFTPDLQALNNAHVLVTTPEKWDGISRNWKHRNYVQNVGLLILDEIHLLGQDRGPVIEVIVSRMNYIASQTNNSIRMIGLSTAMANGIDVANWFGTDNSYFYNFKPQVRPCPVTIYFDGFSEKNYCPRMKTMNKPAFNAIKKFSDDKPVLIFVSSRRQTRLTASDLISMVATDSKYQNAYLKISSGEMEEKYLSKVKDTNLKETLAFGIGMHHAGLLPSDRHIVEELFVNNKIQIMIATSTLAWGVNFPARLVIIKGTEFFDAKTKRYVDFPVTDILQMIGRAGRPQFDDRGVACVFVEQSKKNFYRKYLNDPFPIESNLIEQIYDHMNAEINSGTLKTKQHCMDYFSWTYFFRRLLSNPSYYGLKEASAKEVNSFLVSLVDKIVQRLIAHACIESSDNYSLSGTFLGYLASFYYVKHETIFDFQQKTTSGMTIPQILTLLTNAHEFEEIPVRHNEDTLNEALSKLLPYPPAPHSFDSPHTKTFLLLQAHFTRCPLPVRDYLTDTKIVIESSIRLLSALLDISTEKGYLDTTINIIYIMQMVYQGIWINESPLQNIPGLTSQMISYLDKEKHIRYTCEILYGSNVLDGLLDDQDEALNVLETLPKINFDIKIDSCQDQLVQKDYPLKADGEAVVSLWCSRQYTNSLRVKMMAISKIKDESWYVLIGNQKDNSVLALKKIIIKDKIHKKIQINLPEKIQEDTCLQVYLLSDCYIGLDQVRIINLNNKQTF